LVRPLWRTVWRFLKKVKVELPYALVVLFLGMYPKKEGALKNACSPMFTAALFAIAKTWKQPKCLSTEEWIKKMWCTYTHTHTHTHTMEFYSAIKKNETRPFAATGMDIECHTG